MNRDLATRVIEFYNRVRARPAESVGPELEALAQAARGELSGSYAAQTSPIASHTWLTDAVLLPTELTTSQEPINMPYNCEIVGLFPTVLLIDSTQGIVEPPMEAIQVMLEVDRREKLTARADEMTSQSQDADVVTLPSISASIANRLFGYRVKGAKTKISVRFGWRVDLATVAAMNWGKVLVGIDWFVRPTIEEGP
jgi:hypothetical protein